MTPTFETPPIETPTIETITDQRKPIIYMVLRNGGFGGYERNKIVDPVYEAMTPSQKEAIDYLFWEAKSVLFSGGIPMVTYIVNEPFDKPTKFLWGLGTIVPKNNTRELEVVFLIINGDHEQFFPKHFAAYSF